MNYIGVFQEDIAIHICSLYKFPLFQRHPHRQQVELEASHEELQMAKSELEAAQLKMEHTEAGA